MMYAGDGDEGVRVSWAQHYRSKWEGCRGEQGGAGRGGDTEAGADAAYCTPWHPPAP